MKIIKEKIEKIEKNQNFLVISVMHTKLNSEQLKSKVGTLCSEIKYRVATL